MAEEIEAHESSARLVSVLENRLPSTCFICNQLKLHESSGTRNDLEIFFLGGDLREENEDNLWILFKFFRGDWGQVVTISAPVSFSNGQDKQVPQVIKHSLEFSGILDWSKPFVFVCVDQVISDFLIWLNIRKIGNVIKIYPSYVFYMDRDDALKLELPPLNSSTEVRPLTSPEGETFITSLWPLTANGTEEYVKECIRNLNSGGVYVDGELVSAAIAPGFDGLICCLITHPSHRRMGYASLLMEYMFREMARKGLYPCLDAEIQDHRAVQFHKSGSSNIIGKADYVCFKAM